MSEATEVTATLTPRTIAASYYHSKESLEQSVGTCFSPDTWEGISGPGTYRVNGKDWQADVTLDEYGQVKAVAFA